MPSGEKQVSVSRGPKFQPEPHPGSCDLSHIHQYASSTDRPLAIDLFCCAGGLSLGLEEAGFRVVMGVDNDELALETHRAYFGGVSLFADLSKDEDISAIGDALEGMDISLVAGSPPCQPFSRAGESKIRSLVREGSRKAEDDRRDLWQGFMTLVARAKPAAVLMENVPDLVSGENSLVFRKIVERLEELEYVVHTRVLTSWHHGVPQHRRRVFVVGVRRGASFNWPEPDLTETPTVGDAISDLPTIEAGIVNHSLPYGGPLTQLQEWSRKNVPAGSSGTIHDHFARPVRDDDLEAFQELRPGMRYSEISDDLRRYTTDHFDDKYNRLDNRKPSRTITAHISHDGYWYIHPEQHRTLTVREAARIQTFPDYFRFAGTPTHAYRQIGEAVPPLLAKSIGEALKLALTPGEGEPSYYFSTREASERLLDWLDSQPEGKLWAPWRLAGDLWQILLGMTVFAGRSNQRFAAEWPIYRDRWPGHNAFLEDTRRDEILQSGRKGLGASLDTIASTLATSGTDEITGQAFAQGRLPERWRIALTLAGLSENLRPTAAARRLAERVFGKGHPGSHFGFQTAMARIVGARDTRRAYAAVLEISEKYCRPSEPLCSSCPVNGFCRSYQEQDHMQASAWRLDNETGNP